MKAQSPDKFMDVTSDMNMIDEDGYLSRNMTIRTNWNDDSQLHDEHIITVREEPNLHVESRQRDVTNVERSGE